MATQKEIDALVQLLDQNMGQGSGHINVKVDDPKNIEIEKVDIVSGMGCDSGDTACKIPNLEIDEDDF